MKGESTKSLRARFCTIDVVGVQIIGERTALSLRRECAWLAAFDFSDRRYLSILITNHITRVQRVSRALSFKLCSSNIY